MADTDVLELDGSAQAAAVRSGELSAAELTELAISRIEALNPELNCVVVERFEDAVRDARELDRRGAFAGPLAGVPVLLKDLGQQIRGLAQTDGSRAGQAAARLRGAPEADGVFTARYREAGLVLLGKASSPEFGNHSTSEPAVHGPCRNPWDTTKTAGGSSGGSAAAVAARMVALAGASDGAGSIRIPASCCGVYGLKPSRGRVISGSSADSLGGLAVTHALTRSVRDSATLLDLSLAPGARDAAPPVPRAPFLTEVGADPGTLRVGISTAHTTGDDVDPECVAAAEHTAELLRSLGHTVEQASPSFPVEVITESMLAVWAAANAAGARSLSSALGRPLEREELEETTWELVEHAAGLTDADLAEARDVITAASAQIAAFFERYDLWLTPTLAQLPLPIGVLNRSVGSAAGWWQYDVAFNPWCPVANVSGGPAASLPLHTSRDGLPVGTMLTAGFGQEGLLIRVSAQLEQACPWSVRSPLGSS